MRRDGKHLSGVEAMMNEDKEMGVSGDRNELPTQNKSGAEEEKIPMAFPQILMEILSNKDYAEIISWLPHGNGFIIYQKKRFALEIMPKYFKKSKFTSFTRKLNRWNFVRITRGPETGAYYNQFFRKGETRLCMQMRCHSSQNPPSQGSLGIIPGITSPSQGSLGMPDMNPPMNPPIPGSLGIPDMTSSSLLGTHASDLINTSNASLSTAARLRDVSPLRPTIGTFHDQIGTLQNSSGNQHMPINNIRQLEYERGFLLLQQQQEKQRQQLKLKCLEEEIQHQKNILDITMQNRQSTMLENPSRNISSPDINLNALNNSNTNSYVAMLMAQEKLQQAGLSSFAQTPESIDSTRNAQNQQLLLLQMKQQQELKLRSQLLQDQATTQQHIQGRDFDRFQASRQGQDGQSSDKDTKKGKFSAANAA